MSQPFSWVVGRPVKDDLLLSGASPRLLTPWAILGISAVFSSAPGIFILSSNMGSKHQQCKSRKEATLDDVCYPKLQQRQMRA